MYLLGIFLYKNKHWRKSRVAWITPAKSYTIVLKRSSKPKRAKAIGIILRKMSKKPSKTRTNHNIKQQKSAR